MIGRRTCIAERVDGKRSFGSDIRMSKNMEEKTEDMECHERDRGTSLFNSTTEMVGIHHINNLYRIMF